MRMVQPENLEEREGAGSTANICKISIGNFISHVGETNNISRFYNSGESVYIRSLNLTNR